MAPGLGPAASESEMQTSIHRIARRRFQVPVSDDSSLGRGWEHGRPIAT